MKYRDSNTTNIQLKHVKCVHHKGYLKDNLEMTKKEFYEISFCKNGDFMLRIGHKKNFITKGDILMTPPGVPHCFISSDLLGNYYDLITIWLEKSYILNLKGQLPALDTPAFNIDTPHILHTSENPNDLKECFEHFHQEYAAQGDLWEAHACGISTCLLVKIINYALKYSDESTENKPDITSQLVSYLDQHFLESICVEELAHTFHMSKSSLNKLFQKELNTTCHQYILKKRLALSIKLIRDNVPLKNVATQVGFKDYSTFFRAFKKLYQISPTECQAENKKI